MNELTASSSSQKPSLISGGSSIKFSRENSNRFYDPVRDEIFDRSEPSTPSTLTKLILPSQSKLVSSSTSVQKPTLPPYQKAIISGEHIFSPDGTTFSGTETSGSIELTKSSEISYQYYPELSEGSKVSPDITKNQKFVLSPTSPKNVNYTDTGMTAHVEESEPSEEQ